jgi:hypothetical protein
MARSPKERVNAVVDQEILAFLPSVSQYFESVRRLQQAEYKIVDDAAFHPVANDCAQPTDDSLDTKLV